MWYIFPKSKWQTHLICIDINISHYSRYIQVFITYENSSMNLIVLRMNYEILENRIYQFVSNQNNFTTKN